MTPLGGVAERTKAAVSKTVEPVLPVPWVQIPPPPRSGLHRIPPPTRRRNPSRFGLLE
jgi:hypothetical protein